MADCGATDQGSTNLNAGPYNRDTGPVSIEEACAMLDSGPQHEKLLLRPDVVVSVLEDGAVLLDLETKYFYSANDTGWAILQMFETGATPAQVVAQCRNWGQAPADEAATTQFIGSLIDDRLITTDGSPLPAQEPVWNGDWSPPAIEKQKEPLQRIMTSAFDPTLPLAE